MRSRKIPLDARKCVHCGACAGLCPCGALALRRPDMTLELRPGRCNGCGLCADICPTLAIGGFRENAHGLR